MLCVILDVFEKNNEKYGKKYASNEQTKPNKNEPEKYAHKSHWLGVVKHAKQVDGYRAKAFSLFSPFSTVKQHWQQ